MNKVAACGMGLMLFLVCSPLQAHGDGLEKWSPYKDPRSLKGLHTKPIEVRYETRAIYVNGKRMKESSAIKVLKMSRDLSPSPGIVVYIRRKSLQSSKHLLRTISDSGLCEEKNCWFEVGRP